MSTSVRIWVTVRDYRHKPSSKSQVLVVISPKTFKTVSDVQYNILSQLDISVNNSIVEISIDKFTVLPHESSHVFRDNDAVRIAILSKQAQLIARKEVDLVDSLKLLKKRVPDEALSPRSKPPVVVTTPIKVQKKVVSDIPTSNTTTSADILDVSSVWKMLSVQTDCNVPKAELNVPTKKRKYPQNNEELKYNIETTVVPPSSSSVCSGTKPTGGRKNHVQSMESQGCAAKPASTEAKATYTQLPAVADPFSLLTGDVLAIRYVTLCQRTFTPTLSQYLKVKLTSAEASSSGAWPLLHLTILKVDRLESVYSAGQQASLSWSELGEVRLVQKFTPPLPGGAPPTRLQLPPPPPPPLSSAIAVTPPTEENEAEGDDDTGLSLFALFSDDLVRKKTALLTKL